jgi:hypothetical protein
VIEAVYSSKEEHGDFLPFWKLYVENNYRGEWVCVGRFYLKDYYGRTYVAQRDHKEETPILEAICATKIGMTVERVQEIMERGSKELKLELLRRFVEAIKQPYDRVEQDGEAYVLYHFKTPLEAFEEDVMKGRVYDPRTGLKLSWRQAQGRPPDGGFLQDVIGGTEDYYEALEQGKLGYRVGTVVKICSDYDPDLAKHHNTWAVIVRIIDPWHYEVVQEHTGKKLIIRDTDVKAIIADAFHDYAGIGPERHRKEVIPVIRKALEGKIPIPEGQYPKWPRPPIYQAFAVALLKFGKRDPRRSVEKALKEAEKRLKWVERNRKRFDPEDYRRERGYALLWIRLYQLVLKRLDAVAGKEGKLLFKIDEKAAPEYEKEAYKYVKERLVWNGIPFLELDGKILVHKSDYEKAVKAIVNQRVW